MGLAIKKDNEFPLQRIFWAPGFPSGRQARFMRFWAGTSWEGVMQVIPTTSLPHVPVRGVGGTAHQEGWQEETGSKDRKVQM